MTIKDLKQLIELNSLHSSYTSKNDGTGDMFGFSKDNNRWYWFETKVYSSLGQIRTEETEVYFNHTYNRVNGATQRSWMHSMRAKDMLGICSC